MWLAFAVISSLLLGCYDLLKKASLRGNSFIPVLFIATASGSIIFLINLFLSRFNFIPTGNLFYIPTITLHEHLLYFIKAILVGSSWVLSYMALSRLPLTVVAPIRSTGPIWTIAGAFFIYHERFNFLQWLGIAIAIFGSYMFALAGKKEGISFRHNRGIWAIVMATILGSISAVFDKYLLAHYPRMAVQSWYSIYMGLVMVPFLLIFWFPKRKIPPLFEWHWLIPMIGITLTIADFLYFYALTEPEALLGVVSVIRRSSVVLSFLLGATVFKEHNLKSKGTALAAIVAGVIILVLGS
jgi:bacterial/archaeal transporter family protein